MKCWIPITEIAEIPQGTLREWCELGKVSARKLTSRNKVGRPGWELCCYARKTEHGYVLSISAPAAPSSESEVAGAFAEVAEPPARATPSHTDEDGLRRR